MGIPTLDGAVDGDLNDRHCFCLVKPSGPVNLVTGLLIHSYIRVNGLVVRVISEKWLTTLLNVVEGRVAAKDSLFEMMFLDGKVLSEKEKLTSFSIQWCEFSLGICANKLRNSI